MWNSSVVYEIVKIQYAKKKSVFFNCFIHTQKEKKEQF